MIIGAVTRISTPSGSLACDSALPIEELCCITADQYYLNGCILYRNTIW